MSVGLHEMGHVVDLGGGSDSYLRTSRGVDELVRESGEAAIGSEEFGGSPVVDTKDFVQRSVSGYALHDRRELVAEAFTDVMLNEEAASGLSQGIVAILEAEYNR